MLWKLCVAIVSSGTLIVIALLDYQWWDKRTRLFKKARKALFGLLGLVLVVSVAGVYWDGKAHEAEAADLAARLEVLRTGQDAQARNSEARHDEETAQIRKLQAMLEPFLAVARRHSPSTDDATALRSLADRLRKLEVETAVQVGAVRNLALRREYRPLSAEMRSEVATRCRGLAPQLAHSGVAVGINWFNDPSGTLGQSAQQLRGLLQESGIVVSAFAPVTELAVRRRRAALVCNRSNAALCERFASAIAPLVSIRPIVSAEWNASQIGVMLAGNPAFRENGAMSLE